MLQCVSCFILQHHGKTRQAIIKGHAMKLKQPNNQNSPQRYRSQKTKLDKALYDEKHRNSYIQTTELVLKIKFNRIQKASIRERYFFYTAYRTILSIRKLIHTFNHFFFFFYLCCSFVSESEPIKKSKKFRPHAHARTY